MSARKAGAASNNSAMRRSSRFPATLGRSPLTSPAGGPGCGPMKLARRRAGGGRLPAGGHQPPAPQGPAEVQLSTDLNPGMVDAALTMIARSGGPRGERIAGMHAGVSVLPGAAGAPVPGGEQTPKPAASGDVRWDSEPYGAIAAAAKGELLPAPKAGSDVPPRWRDPGGAWVAVGGRAVVLLVATDELGDHGAPVRFTALTEPWLKGRVAVSSPTGGMALAHFAALYAAWGAERMDAWLKQLKANEPQLYADDDQVRQAVVSGRAIVGMVASDEAAKAAASAAGGALRRQSGGRLGRSRADRLGDRPAQGRARGLGRVDPQAASDRHAGTDALTPLHPEHPRRARLLLCGSLLGKPEQLPERKSRVELAPRPSLAKHVPVAPAVPLPQEVTALLQLGDDPLHRALGDPDPLSDLAQRQRRLLRNAAQDVEVIGEKPPGRTAHERHPARPGDPVQKTGYSGSAIDRPATSGRSSGSSIEVSTIFGRSGNGGGGCCATTRAARLPMSSSRGIRPVKCAMIFSRV